MKEAEKVQTRSASVPPLIFNHVIFMCTCVFLNAINPKLTSMFYGSFLLCNNRLINTCKLLKRLVRQHEIRGETGSTPPFIAHDCFSL